MRSPRLIAALLGTALLAASAAATAQGEDARSARLLTQQGNEALVRNDFQTAADRFTRADAIVHDQVTALGLARAQVGLGKLASARATYESIVSEGAPRSASPAVKKAVEDAGREMQALQPRLAWITIELEAPGDPKVALDGSVVERSALGQMRAIDPGKHTVKVTGDGLQADETVIVSAGEERIVKLMLRRAATAPAPEPAPEPELVPASAPPPRPDGGPQRTAGVISLVVGGAGMALGAVTGLMAASRQEDLSVACPHGACGPSYHAKLDEYRILGTVSTIGFVTAGVGLGVGVLLLATSPSGPPRPPRGEQARRTAFEIAPTVGIGTLGATGRF